MWKEINLTTQSRNQFIDITAQVRAEIAKSDLKNGFCNLFIPHTTAGVTVNENTDPNVIRDIINTLERLAPKSGQYQHSEGNSDAHIKASLIGSSCMIPINNGQLNLGTWQGIFFCEFDGPRNRKVKIQMFGA
ncbi:MAG: secondary thiamine-phosphate synthase enzyme YjbQ [Bacillota bacterium]